MTFVKKKPKKQKKPLLNSFWFLNASLLIPFSVAVLSAMTMSLVFSPQVLSATFYSIHLFFPGAFPPQTCHVD